MDKDIRQETSSKLISKIKTMKAIAREISTSEVTLRKIKSADESVSLNTVKKVNLLLDTI